MYDKSLLREKLEQISEALERIERRFSGISSADDFLDSDKGLDMLDSIAMMMIAIGENFKTIDKETQGELLKKYPGIHWSGVKGVRDVISHHYFNIDAEEIFLLCNRDLLPLKNVVKSMIMDIQL